MNELNLLSNNLILGGLLFGIGMIGFIARRNLIVMFLSVEMMLQGVSLTLVAFSRYHGTWNGQILAIFIVTVAAVEAAIALALILMLFRRRDSLDVSLWQSLREPELPPIVDERHPEPLPEEAPRPLPHLPVAGLSPGADGGDGRSTELPAAPAPSGGTRESKTSTSSGRGPADEPNP